AEGDPDANKKFYEEASKQGWFGMSMAAAVALAGPSTQYILQNKDQVTTKMPRRAPTKSSRKGPYDRPERNRGNPLENIQEANDDLNAGDITGETFVNAINEVEVKPNGDFVTPNVPTMRAEPSMTREDAPSRASRATDLQSFGNLLNEEQSMEDTRMEAAPMAMRSMDASDSGNPAKNKSVMVQYDARQEMGFLTEMRTAMLPLSIYFSINKLDSAAPVVFSFVLNDTYDIFRNVTLQTQTFPTPGGAWSA
ncbi:hypothetical protein, partial [Escherichia coli]|uniref:hypothetical protein n=1 Tax=Escherichia coli TaxID=562 RepID=UPI001412E557